MPDPPTLPSCERPEVRSPTRTRHFRLIATTPDCSRASPRTTPALLLLPILQALAVATVAYAFALSRSLSPQAHILYWCGELCLVVVPVFLILRYRPEQWALGAAVASTGVCSFTIMLTYQPLYLAFGDEFQHSETLRSILLTGHLFAPNSSLPVSSVYPGLEIATAALVQLTHISTYAAEMAIAGAAHVTTLLLVFAILLTLTRNARASAIGAILYTLNPQYQFIDSYFTYTAFGLLFTFSAILCLLVALQSSDQASRVWSLAAAAFTSACVVSHHVSSYICIAFLALIGGCEFAAGRQKGVRASAWAVLPASLVAVLWTAFVAPDVVGYLAPVGRDLISGLLHHVSTTRPPRSMQGSKLPRLRTTASPSSPRADRYLEYAGTGVLLIMYSFSLLTRARSRHRRRTPATSASNGSPYPPGDSALVIASLLFYFLVAVRVALPDGSQLSSRLYAYALLPVAYVLVTTPAHLLVSRPWTDSKPRLASLRAVGAAALAGIVWAGAVAGGWPPSYARLPGPALAAAWERSADPAVMAASQWAASHLKPHLYFVSDQMTAGIFAGLADETAVSAPTARIFLAATMSPQVVMLLRRYDISLIVVNRIIAEQLPADGNYFTDDPFSRYYASPIPMSDLAKFLTWNGGSIVYNNSQVAIIALSPQ